MTTEIIYRTRPKFVADFVVVLLLINTRKLAPHIRSDSALHKQRAAHTHTHTNTRTICMVNKARGTSPFCFLQCESRFQFDFILIPIPNRILA